MKCDQCNALYINGVFCHESGCPNEKKKFIDGEWILMVNCFLCGFEIEEGSICPCEVREEEF